MQIPRKMSAQNVMASISRSLGTRARADSSLGNSKSGGTGVPPGSEVKLAGEESKDRLYEPKHQQKIIRVLTVFAYIISVSLAAIVLSLYYMYIWDPSDHHQLIAKQRLAMNASLQAQSSVITLCQEIGQAVANEDRSQGNVEDKTTPVSTTTEDLSGLSDTPSPSQPSRSLLKALTTRSNRRNEDYVTDLPERRRPNSEDYQDGTIVPADEVLDD